jgi:hypothetical protein
MKSSGWGGRRPGSGPKPKYMMSSNQVKKMLRRMRKSKRETGVDEDEFLVSIISTGKTPEGEEVDIKERLSAVKIFKDYTRSKHTEKDINIIAAIGFAHDRKWHGILNPNTRPPHQGIVIIN